MTAEPSPAPSATDFTIARLVRQRDAAERTVDTLSAAVAALEREKAELADKLAELTADAAADDKET